jgi:hypothetical protein
MVCFVGLKKHLRVLQVSVGRCECFAARKKIYHNRFSIKSDQYTQDVTFGTRKTRLTWRVVAEKSTAFLLGALHAKEFFYRYTYILYKYIICHIHTVCKYVKEALTVHRYILCERLAGCCWKSKRLESYRLIIGTNVW